METATPTSQHHQPLYAGQFRHFIDEKKRITIPARWRRRGSEEFIILPEAAHQFLLVMSPEEFSRMSAVRKPRRTFPRAIAEFFCDISTPAPNMAAWIDKGGSFSPEDLCKGIGLKGEVALVGGRGRFEIWNLERWKKAHEEETATYQHVANVIGL